MKNGRLENGDVIRIKGTSSVALVIRCSEDHCYILKNGVVRPRPEDPYHYIRLFSGWVNWELVE